MMMRFRSRVTNTILAGTFLTGACLAAGILTATPSLAQKLDLSTMTCEAFLKLEKADMGVLLAWMDAYYRDEDSPAVIDFAKMSSDAGKLGKACAENPTLGLITIADKLFEK